MDNRHKVLSKDNPNYAEGKNNFSFLKDINLELYKRVIEAEKIARLDISASALRLREALEFFLKQIANKQPAYKKELDECRDGSKLYMRIKVLSYPQYSGLNFDTSLANKIKRCGNREAHPDKHKVTYNELTENGLSNMHALLRKYYGLKKKKYDPLLQPFRDIYIYEAKEYKNEEFNAEFWGIKNTEGTLTYYIIREYTDGDNKREQNASLKLYTNTASLTYIAVAESPERRSSHIKNDPTFYLYYRFRSKPYSLFFEYTKEKISFWSILTEDEKTMIMKQLAKGLLEMHSCAHGIFHRNLNPDCISICFIGGEICAIIRGFEYSKIKDDPKTVIGKVVNRKGNPYQDPWSMVLPPTKKNSDNFLWSASDIYSLGALYATIISGKVAKDGEDMEKIKKGLPERYLAIVNKMCASDPMFRPGLNEIIKTLNEIPETE